METIKKPERLFGGKTSDFKDKAEKKFEQAHLKAYLAGHKLFAHGFNSIQKHLPANQRRIYHEVKVIIPNPPIAIQ